MGALAQSHPGLTTCQKQTVVSSFVADVFYQDPKTLVDSFRGTSFNTIATILAWSVFEKEHGHVDISMYYPQLDALTKAGYCLIVLIDTSGRVIRSDVAKLLVKDISTIPQSSRPDWIEKLAKNPNSIDFSGAPGSTLDFEDVDSFSLVKNVYVSILRMLHHRYGNNIVGISPCITSECEVKYTQHGFRWQSYSPTSQKAFRTQLANWGLKPVDMPVMNYGTHLSNGNPRVQPMYPYLQRFREHSLRNYVCALTQIIRDASFKSIGYFGQTFTLGDGIYASGVIEKASSCFDIAAIDYNFYNGHGIEFKPDIPAFLADYGLALGYKQVLIGLYMERFRDEKSLVVDRRGYEILHDSLARIHPDERLAGVEIGNLTGDEFRSLGYVKKLVATKTIHTKVSSLKTKTVALYASVGNSYLWEGEWSNERQLLQDNLVATYSALKAILGIRLEIVTDEQMRERPWTLSQFDLIVLPHISAMPDDARSALIRYAALGGRLLADMRPDAYHLDGSVQIDGELRSVLGVGAVQAFSAPYSVMDGTKTITISKQNQYIDGLH